MEDKILSAMATDLKVGRYANETDNQYCSRVIYSALACWEKAAALDKLVGHDGCTGVSRRHILVRCKPFLIQMLLRYPALTTWFGGESQLDSSISLIRSRLIRFGELLNVGFQTNLMLTDEEIHPITSSLALFRGILTADGAYYAGIAALGNCVSPYEISAPERSVQWLDAYVENAWWKRIERIEQGIQFFSASKKTRNNYSCWQDTPPEKNSNLVLVRRMVKASGFAYSLLQMGELIMEHRIDPFLNEIGENRRFMFAFRTRADNKVPCRASLLEDHVHIQLWSQLPQKEYGLLESYAWPHNSIEDKLEWDMPLQVWSYIKLSFEALGLDITEEYDG